MSELTLTLPQALNRAVSAYNSGKFGEAEQICRQIVNAKHDFFDGLHLLALVQSSLGKKDLALASYDRALTLRPDSAEALSNRGLVLHELKRYEEALASYDRALAVRPDFAEALFNRGNVLHAVKRYDEALASYDRALALRPDYAKALANRGLTLHELKRYEEALASCDRALAVRPDYAEALFNRGNALRELKRFEEALASYDRALAIRPDYADALANGAVALRELKRFEEALASCDRALALRPDLAEALSNRGNILRELRRLDDALASYDRALAVRPGYAEALTNRGLTLQGLNRFEEALASYQRAVSAQPEHAEAHYSLGVALTALGRLPEAHASLEHAVALAPTQIKYQHKLGEITRFVASQPDVAALEKLAVDSSILPVDERIELHFALGSAYEDLDRHEDAFAQWLEGNAIKRRQITYDEATTLRMLNSIRAAFIPELMEKWRNVGHYSSIPIFIIGMPRSGSTLVEQILASHPQVFGAGELEYFGEAVREITARLGGTQELLVSAMTADNFFDLGGRYVAEIERLAPHAIRITDKMPENFIFAGLIYLALPNATIIHTVRDPVDTCLSCFSRLFNKLTHTYDLAELGRYYRHYQALMAHWHRVLPAGRILDVRYEDVVADLEGQARRIIAHCGLDWDPRCLDFHRTERPVLTPSAAQVRQPIYNSAVGRWRVHEKALGPLLAELGIAGSSGSN
jgi:tetratricopeptide (TPR) repeat protein